jgi:hypothetical protein
MNVTYSFLFVKAIVIMLWNGKEITGLWNYPRVETRGFRIITTPPGVVLPIFVYSREGGDFARFWGGGIL